MLFGLQYRLNRSVTSPHYIGFLGQMTSTCAGLVCPECKHTAGGGGGGWRRIGVGGSGCSVMGGVWFGVCSLCCW